MAHPKTNPITECRYVGSRNMAQIHCQVPRYATRLNASNDCTSIRSHPPSLFNAHLRVYGQRSLWPDLGALWDASYVHSTAMLDRDKSMPIHSHTACVSLLLQAAGASLPPQDVIHLQHIYPHTRSPASIAPMAKHNSKR